MTRHHAYMYRSFEHHKRETLPLMVEAAETLEGELRVADLGCGPGVLDAMLLSRLGERIASLDLFDVSEGFLSAARDYLPKTSAQIQYHTVDLNKPEQLSHLDGLSLIVSVQALFHVRPEALPQVYAWCFSALKAGGILVNHQTMGYADPRFADVLSTHAGSLGSTAALDELDAELLRRAQIDGAGGDETSESGGGYAGLALSSADHTRMLNEAGFVADEIWRKGESVMVLAKKAN